MKQFIALFIVLATSSWLCASTPVVPNTTLTAETSNNTSAASTFQTQTANGNLGATNISKVSIKSLLYPGFNGKVYVHFMPWFGGTNHMNVGYESNDATQVAKQVTDLISRGVDGAIVDWYGPKSLRADGTTKLLRAEAEKHPGFQFAVTEDVGALKTCAATAGCDITGQMISDLTYAYNTYETSSAYIKYNGRPVVFFFGVEKYSIDWTRVAASVPGKPLFIQRNASAFSNSAFSGAFAWVSPNASDPTDLGDTYLNNFYKAGVANTGDLAYGTAYKGFNDVLAAWSANRVMKQNCGQTFLDTFAQIAKYYSTSRQLFALQLATWNDYEEATELETGIENCVSVSASASGSKVSWSASGNANTLDHYTVFISTDGTNLMTVGDVPLSQTSYDFSGYALAPGSYTVYVKAVGASFMRNHMSSAVPLTIGNKAPVAKLTMTPTSSSTTTTVTANATGSTDADGYIAKTVISFGDGTTATSATASHVYGSAGTYTVTATVTDDGGASASTSALVLVAAPATTANGVTVTSPTASATVSGAVKFVASAKSINPITAMRIYVDNVSKYVVSAASINTTLTLSTGTRAITVQAWDSKGNIYKSSFKISVK
ncbi:MAG TPA: PKD domain-containing protein [Candidatus Saccharimonadales bacterium]|nr:PKD domain-containing protein [Candidatus Saccharimonadales bacterium]